MRSLYLRALHLAHLARRPLTLGVRAAAFDADGRVFLVRHTYVSGWYLPGGGVDAGETAEAALRRELAEEGNLAVDRLPEDTTPGTRRRLAELTDGRPADSAW